MLEYLTFPEAFTCSEGYNLYSLQVQRALRHPSVCCEHPDGRLGLFYVYLYQGQVAWYHNGRAKMLEPAPVRLRTIILTYMGKLHAIGINGIVYSYAYENYTAGKKGWYILRYLKEFMDLNGPSSMGPCVGFDDDYHGHLKILCTDDNYYRLEGDVTPHPPQRPLPIQWLLSQVPQPFG